MISRLLMLSLFTVLYFSASAQNLVYENSVDILHQKDPAVKHKAYDVDIIWMRDSYKIEFYVKRKGKAELREAWIHTFEIYDTAEFTWETKNKCAIRLLNSSTGKETAFKVFVDKNATGTEVDHAQFSKT